MKNVLFDLQGEILTVFSLEAVKEGMRDVVIILLGVMTS